MVDATALYLDYTSSGYISSRISGEFLANSSFLDQNKKKAISSHIYISVSKKRNDFGLPIVNSPWLSGDIRRLSSYSIYIS